MPLQMKYFVLKPAGNDRYAYASRRAMKTYAVEIAEVDPSLSDSLMEWYNREERKLDLEEYRKEEVYKYENDKNFVSDSYDARKLAEEYGEEEVHGEVGCH